MREKILDEIKRLAKANGGTPPGQNVFAKETGYKPHEWEKYWARWGDAVREAGLVAQEWSSKLNAMLFYPKLAEAVRYYKRLPTIRELQLFRKINPVIPSAMTLKNHFSSQAGMNNSIRQWAMATEEYADIVAMLPEIQLDEKKSQCHKRRPRLSHQIWRIL